MEVAGMGDKGSVTKNPLEIPEVLQRIFSFCELDELKSCRLVSRFWRQNSLNSFRSSALLQIRSSWVGSSPNGTSMSLFLEFIENGDENYLSTQFPYTFKVYDDNKRFWTICGHLIKILTLDSIRFLSSDDFRNAVFNCCPNLEQLSLEIVDFDEESDDKEKEGEENIQPLIIVNKKLRSISLFHVRLEDKITWIELLSHFPCLEGITLDGNILPDTLVESILKIREQDPTKLKLRHVNFFALEENNSQNKDLLLTLLLDSDLHLETIGIDVTSYSQEDGNKLAQVFNLHSSYLKKLKIRNWYCSFDFDFPSENQKKLEKLEELELEFSTFLSLMILKLTPNIKKFVLKNGRMELLEATSFGNMTDVKLTKCVELEFDFNEREFEIEYFAKLTEWFPEVRKLSIDLLNNEHLSLICEKWPNLEELRVWESGIDDCGLAGLDIEDVELINLEGTEDSSTRPIILSRRANIASLKCLRSLVLNGSYDPYPRLGYCAVHLGIKRIPNLKYLHIEGYEFESQDLWSSLSAQFPGLPRPE